MLSPATFEAVYLMRNGVELPIGGLLLNALIEMLPHKLGTAGHCRAVRRSRQQASRRRHTTFDIALVSFRFHIVVP